MTPMIKLRQAVAVLVALAGAFGAMPALATLLITDGGSGDPVTAGVTPDPGHTSEVLEGATWDGYFGGALEASEATTLEFEFIGFEAGWSNQFSLGGVERFDTEDYAGNQEGTLSTPIGESFTAEVPPGVISFAFTTNAGGASSMSVANGSNPDASGEVAAADVPNFFLSMANSEATEGSVAYLFLDDSGASNDGDHDDLVVRVSEVMAVPEPRMLALLGIALVGLAAALRLRALE